MIDLGARARWAAAVYGIGAVVLPVLGSALVVNAVVGPEVLPVRIITGVFGALIVLLCVGLWLGRNVRPRWLGIDHEGVRLVNKAGQNLARIAWADLAGVGVMTNEKARRRHRFGNGLTSPTGNRTPTSVGVWLELHPASTDAVTRHPSLRRQWLLGAPRQAGQQQRWLVYLCDDLGQAPLPVGEYVRRWRPDLWRGHREGSLLFG